jgi:hypothetical protein
VGSFSHLGFLYPDPEGVPSFISRGAARRTTAAPQLAKEGTMNGNFACDPVIHINRRFFYMPQSWDMGQILLLPLRRKAC